MSQLDVSYMQRIDAECAQKYSEDGKYHSSEQHASFINIVKKYLATNPHQASRVKKILSSTENTALTYYIYIFDDTQSLLELLENTQYDVSEAILLKEPEKTVLDAIFAKDFNYIYTYLEMHPDQKDNYAQQLLKNIEAQYPKLEALVYCPQAIINFADYYSNTPYFIELFDKIPLTAENCRTLLTYNHSDEIIDKLLHLTFKKNVSNSSLIYNLIISASPNQKTFKKLTKYHKPKELISALRYKKLEPKFALSLIEHQECSLSSLYYLLRDIPKKHITPAIANKIADKIIASDIKKFPDDYIIRSICDTIMSITPNDDILQKFYEWSKNSFNQEKTSEIKQGVYLDILKNDTKKKYAKPILDYFTENDNFTLYGNPDIACKLLQSNPTPKTLSQLVHYYQTITPSASYMQEIEEDAAPPTDEYETDITDIKQQSQDCIMWLYIAGIEIIPDFNVVDKLVTKVKRYLKTNPNKESLLYSFNTTLDKIKYKDTKLKKIFPNLSPEKVIPQLIKKIAQTKDKKEERRLREILYINDPQTILSSMYQLLETKDNILFQGILKEKEYFYNILPQFDEYERGTIYTHLQNIETKLTESNYIETVLKIKYPHLPFEEALITEALRVQKSQSQTEKEKFYNFILAEGEKRILNDIDEKVCNYLIENFTPNNLEKVNALRAFYGLRIIIDESKFEDANLRAVRRMQFDDSISGADKESIYYPIQYSEAYRTFKADRRRKFNISDYYDMLDESEAVRILMDHGYNDLVDHIPEALALAKIPPKVALKFNIKDLQTIVYNYIPDKEVFSWDGDYLFTKRWVEIDGTLDSDNLKGARESYWMDLCQNKSLIKTIKDDLLRHNISEDDISKLFEYAEEEGYPNSGGKRRRVNSVFFQLHHVLGLKDGGLNYPRNYAPVCRYPEDTYSGEGCYFSSHTPLHRHDTPLDILYLVNPQAQGDEIMISTLPKAKARKVRIRTVFVDDDNPHKKILYYGGARSCSRYLGRLHGMENIAIKAKKLGEKQKLKNEKTKLLMQIVFQNYVEMHKKLAHHQQENEGKKKKKRQKIEKNKQTSRHNKRSLTSPSKTKQRV